jgi:hypothetical protein
VSHLPETYRAPQLLVVICELRFLRSQSHQLRPHLELFIHSAMIFNIVVGLIQGIMAEEPWQRSLGTWHRVDCTFSTSDSDGGSRSRISDVETIPTTN